MVRTGNSGFRRLKVTATSFASFKIKVPYLSLECCYKIVAELGLTLLVENTMPALRCFLYLSEIDYS